MTQPVPMTEIWRGDILESQHNGHAVVCNGAGEIVDSWGDANKIVLPRSSSKMIQALPLIESGAADAAGLSPKQLALACASHNASEIHNTAVNDWLTTLGFSDDDFRCGPEEPRDIDVNTARIRCDGPVCQVHNNCSGKHSGFLTLTKHLSAGPDYIDPAHPIQRMIEATFEEVTQANHAGFVIDGCSAPNHATSLRNMARAMAFFATAKEGGGTRETAAARLRNAMAQHPDYVAGETRACTKLMRAMGHKVAIKTGAEGYYVAMLPEQGLGIALKIADGTTRAAECTIAALLVKYGALDPAHPVVGDYIDAPIRNRRNVTTGYMRPTAALR